MAEAPETEADAVFTDVRGQSVATARVTLAAFTNKTWQDEDGTRIRDPDPDWLVSGQQPREEIGQSAPTDLAIVLTIGPS